VARFAENLAIVRSIFNESFARVDSRGDSQDREKRLCRIGQARMPILLLRSRSLPTTT
jgi:hypothetical protein